MLFLFGYSHNPSQSPCFIFRNVMNHLHTLEASAINYIFYANTFQASEKKKSGKGLFHVEFHPVLFLLFDDRMGHVEAMILDPE